MKRMKNMKYLKRLLCLIISLFCFLANNSLAFANVYYDSSSQSIDDFYNMDENNSLIKIQISGNGNNLVGNDIDQDSTLTLDNTKIVNFSVITNSDDMNQHILYAISRGEDKHVLLNPEYNEKDGTSYFLTVKKEEIVFENIKLINNYELEGKFNFNGEYLAEELDGTASKELKVHISGTVESFNYGDYDNKLFLYFECKAEDNQGIFEVDGESQVKTIVMNNNDFDDNIYDQYTLDVELRILNAEFADVQDEVVPILNTTDTSNTDSNDIDTSNTDSNDILNEEVTALIEKEEVNKELEDTFKTESPGKVAAAVVVSIALATTGSAALSGASGSAMKNFVELEEQNDEMQKQSDGEEDTRNKENNSEYSFIINNGESMPELCNSKGSVINIPIYIENGEDLIWNFNFIPICPNGLNAVAGAVVNPDGNNSTNLSISITGKQFVENSLQIFCNIAAYTEIDESKIKIHDAFELTIYNLGLHASIKDNCNGLSDDNLNVIYVRDSKIKGIAEIIQLKSDEFNYVVLEDTNSQIKVNIFAIDKKYGSCILEIIKPLV